MTILFRFIAFISVFVAVFFMVSPERIIGFQPDDTLIVLKQTCNIKAVEHISRYIDISQNYRTYLSVILFIISVISIYQGVLLTKCSRKN